MEVVHQYRRANGAGITRWHADKDKPGVIVSETIFDRDVAIERAAIMRNEFDQRGDELRLVMTVPDAMFFEWLKSGKLSDEDFVNVDDGIAIKPQKLKALTKEFSALACMDKF